MCTIAKHIRPFRHSFDSLSFCRDIEAFITLRIPRIEDGNTFGAEVQSKMLNQTREAIRLLHVVRIGLSIIIRIAYISPCHGAEILTWMIMR